MKTRKRRPRSAAPGAGPMESPITVVPTQAYSAERAERAYMTDLRHLRSTLTEDRVANASMVMTYDRTRAAKRAGKVTPQTLEDIDRALAMHLGLVLAGSP